MTPQELKYSILRIALQGKLVEQNQDDLPVNLTEVKSKKTDDYEFEAPENWGLAHLETVTNGIPSKQYQILESEVQQTGKFPVISQSKAYSIGFTDKSEKVFCHDKPVIIFGDHTTEVKYVEFDFVVGADGVKIFEPIDGIITAEFLFYVFQFYTKDLNKVGGYSRHYKFIKNKPIPIPPLAEQKRIVAKIEELLPYIDRYEKAWSRLEDLNKRFPVDMQKSILQMAIQGKLVEQRPEEGTAEELYQQIQEEKKQLIKAGKIKKGKSLPEITEDEIPFDIPESWKWVRLGNVCWFQGGYAYKSTSYVHDSRNQIIRLGNVKQNQLLLDTKPTYIPDSIAEVTEAYLIKKNDILVTMTGTRRKKDYLFVTRINDADLAERKLYINQRVGCFRVIDHRIESEYLQRVLQSEAIRDIIFERETGTANQGNLGSEDMKMYIYVPLPPLAEQKRIVAKLEEILPMCDKLK